MFAITPASCIPVIVSAFNWPERYGSMEKPSQFRPPRGVRPSGPALGPSGTLTDGAHKQRIDTEEGRRETEILTSFCFELPAHMKPPLVRQVSIPARPDVDARGIRIDQVGCANSVAGIVDTHAGPSQARNRASVAGTDIVAGESARDVGLFFECHLSH
jgi:hypothetical protein